MIASSRAGVESPRLHGLAFGAMESAQKVHDLLVRFLGRAEIVADHEPPADPHESAEPMLVESVRLQTKSLRLLEEAMRLTEPEMPAVESVKKLATRARGQSSAPVNLSISGMGGGLE